MIKNICPNNPRRHGGGAVPGRHESAGRVFSETEHGDKAGPVARIAGENSGNGEVWTFGSLHVCQHCSATYWEDDDMYVREVTQ